MLIMLQKKSDNPLCFRKESFRKNIKTHHEN